MLCNRFLLEKILLQAFGMVIILCYSFSADSVIAQQVVIEGTVILEQSHSGSNSLDFGGYRSISSSGRLSEENSTTREILIWLEDNNSNVTYVDRDTVRPVLDQVNKQFEPRLMAIRTGDSVRIKNSDPVYHNVFSLSKTKRFDVGRRSPKDSQDVRFNNAGKVDVFCDLHSNMHAVIWVLPEQTVTWQKLKESGTFRLEGIPYGEYTLHLFAIGHQNESIEIKTTGTNKITLNPVRLGAQL